MRRSIEERFWPKVHKTEGCWIWTAARDAGGYGWFGLPGRNGGSEHAHRVAYRLLVGPIPPGASVCHRCDNRACVNPDHLFLGTDADNVADMVSKGRNRGAVGSRNCHARVSEEDIPKIRAMVKQGHAQNEVARYFGVSAAEVNKIVLGHRWRHVPCEH